MRTRRYLSLIVCWMAVCYALTGPGSAQARAPAKNTPLSKTDTAALVDQATKLQLEDFHHPSWALRYRVHRKDNKEDSVRDLIESTDGNVARTLQRNGQPLPSQQDVAEQQRLKSLTPADMEKHHHGSPSSDKFGAEMINAMPTAMIYTPVPGQPQLSQFSTDQVVLDYAPNPDFHPSGTVEGLLTGLAGRLWIDAETHHVLRIEINVMTNLNLAFGMLARVYRGGRVVYEQHPIGGGHYAFSHIEIDVRLRELMVKTVPYRMTMDASDIFFLPSPPTLAEAVSLLLNTPQLTSHHE